VGRRFSSLAPALTPTSENRDYRRTAGGLNHTRERHTTPSRYGLLRTACAPTSTHGSGFRGLVSCGFVLVVRVRVRVREQGGRDCRYRETPRQSHRGLYRGLYQSLHRGCHCSPIGAVFRGLYRADVSWQVQAATSPKLKLQLQLEMWLQPPTPNSCNCNSTPHAPLHDQPRQTPAWVYIAVLQLLL
jgi:hypothetical protein